MDKILLAFLLLCIIVFVGCGTDKAKFTEEELLSIPLLSQEELPAASGGFTLSVGAESVSAEKIIRPFVDVMGEYANQVDYATFSRKVRGRLEEYITGEISNVLLYNKAREDGGEQMEGALEKAVAMERLGFVTSFGGDYAKAEKALAESGMDWQSFSDYQRKQLMIQSYIGAEVKDERPVTYSDLLGEYEKIKEAVVSEPVTMQFQVIDIEVSKERADANESAAEKGASLAAELLDRVESGEEFGKLAEEYSHGPWAALGGEWKPVRADSLAEPYDILGKTAEGMQAGEIAGPIEAGGHFFILKLLKVNRHEVPSLSEVQEEIEARIFLSRRKTVVDELSRKMVKQAAISRQEEFVDFCIQLLYARCRAGGVR
jgi:hypothetical protein